MELNRHLPIGQCATLACLLEVTAPKPGNVHRGADFEDMTFWHFVCSATAIGPVMEQAAVRGVGPTVLDAIQATRQWSPVNTNLGTVLLLSPLASVPAGRPLRDGLQQVLDRLSAEDAAQVYEAIRLARPGGLGKAAAMDVAGPAPADLLAAMRQAAAIDLIARQYVTGFACVLQEVVPWLLSGLQQSWLLSDTVIHTHVRLISHYGDSLIARKCGQAFANDVADRAAAVLEAGRPGQPQYEGALADLDFWLRCDHHHRNPGTTADLVAAGLFVLLRQGLLKGPVS
jgi:triphosphoribosyl-dephospho-CoA synthase